MSDNVQKRNESMAIASMICGIVGIIFSLLPLTIIIGFVCSILGIIFSNTAKNKIKSDPNLTGEGMAKAGMICGIIGIIIGVIVLIGFGAMLNEMMWIV